ncbi:hypothetical protein D3C73_1145420 [compost metagenome]
MILDHQRISTSVMLTKQFSQLTVSNAIPCDINNVIVDPWPLEENLRRQSTNIFGRGQGDRIVSTPRCINPVELPLNHPKAGVEKIAGEHSGRYDDPICPLLRT